MIALPFRVRGITHADAEQIALWQYDGPYVRYSFDPEKADESVAYLLDPANQMFAVDDANGMLVSCCSVGADAQVPGGHYPPDALDIGVSMRPDLTGRGFGTALVQTIVDYAVRAFRPNRLRATIAEFNLRSQRVFKRCGFRLDSRFLSQHGDPFLIYICDVTPPI